MPVLTITKVDPDPRQWEAKKGPAAGKKFLSYTVSAKEESGRVAQYEISKLPESPPPELGPGEYTIEAASDSRFLPKLKSIRTGTPGGSYKSPDPERSRRIERQHSQDMAIRALALTNKNWGGLEQDKFRLVIADWTDHFQQDLDADVGSGQAAHGASDNHPPVAEDAADLSAESQTQTTVSYSSSFGDEPASRSQKARLTKLFHEAGLSRDAMKAVVLWRCGAEKATKKGASELITDLQEGATHDALLAEIWDAHRAGNPLGTRAASLIPSEVPWTDDGSLPEAKVAE